MRKATGEGSRHRVGIPYMNQEMSAILREVERETSDHALAQTIYFGPTALTHIKRLIEMGGSIITDTTLVANDIDEMLMGRNGAKVLCFIDDEICFRQASSSDVC